MSIETMVISISLLSQNIPTTVFNKSPYSSFFETMAFVQHRCVDGLKTTVLFKSSVVYMILNNCFEYGVGVHCYLKTIQTILCIVVTLFFIF